MKKFFAMMLLAVALVFGLNQNNQVEATSIVVSEYVVARNIDFLALRSGPSVRYSMLLNIPPGAHVTVTHGGIDSWSQEGWRDYDDNFLKVKYNGVTGYSHGRYLTFVRSLRSYT